MRGNNRYQRDSDTRQIAHEQAAGRQAVVDALLKAQRAMTEAVSAADDLHEPDAAKAVEGAQGAVNDAIRKVQQAFTVLRPGHPSTDHLGAKR